jgi:hypothetical protein
MGEEIHGLTAFYAAPAGGLTARLLRRRLARLWPRLTGLDVLGIGHAEPYLPLWREEAARCIALAPAQLGPARFAHGGVSSAVLAEEDALPFPDLSFDRILLVHGLEAAERMPGGCSANVGACCVMMGACWWSHPIGAGFGRSLTTHPSAMAGLIRQHRFRGCCRRRCFAWNGATPRFTCRPSRP